MIRTIKMRPLMIAAAIVYRLDIAKQCNVTPVYKSRPLTYPLNWVVIGYPGGALRKIDFSQ
jgi:hypothetical protein